MRPPTRVPTSHPVLGGRTAMPPVTMPPVTMTRVTVAMVARPLLVLLLLTVLAACTPRTGFGADETGAPAGRSADGGPTPGPPSPGPPSPGSPDAGPPDPGPPGRSAPGGGAPPQPVGQRGGWRLTFSDEFDGGSLDPARWSDRSSAEPDEGRGNLDNQQLEWNQAANCRVGGGELVMTARRETVISPSTGRSYGWTSCLITAHSTAAFQYGYLEERAVLPAPRGFWPAFWTWQARGTDRHVETDVYEFYSDNHQRLYSTQFSGAQGRCEWRPPFDPSGGWHTYGVAIQPSGTTWYADGRSVCHTDATSDGLTTVISNLAVYAAIPPAESTRSATKRVDYIRLWTPQ